MNKFQPSLTHHTAPQSKWLKRLPCLPFMVALLLQAFTSQKLSAELRVVETPETIQIMDGDQSMLTYHKAVVEPPSGKKAAFARSGFIHPLRTPSGGVVTSIHADDHIHHMGLWHAWVKTEHRDRHFDFWNIGDETGKVRFVRTLSTFSHDNQVGFAVVQEQVGLSNGGSSQEVILEETLRVNVEKQQGNYLIDYDTTQTNVTKDPLVLPAYRYGGCIAYRAPYHWNKENSNYLTSEGMDRSNGHTTRGNWCAMFGPTETGVATLAILCHPENRDAPQRMRVWPDGKVFFNYVPIQEKGWEIKPGAPSTMRYRVVIADGKPKAENLNQLWKNYANP